jgi:hypothetical protein
MITYKNGNTVVLLFSDGTKIRHIPDNEVPRPVKPESIDLKITDYCERHCSFCYEHSNSSGRSGDLDHPILDTLSAGTELAIGGGDPLSHLYLDSFLERMRNRGVVCNLTIHCHTYCWNKRAVHELCERGLIQGLGLSVGDGVNIIRDMEFSDMPRGVIFHTIIGITPNSVIKNLAQDYKVLLLGNKTQQPDILTVNELRSFISSCKDNVKGIYFDNLACQQLEIQSLVSEDIWKERYMGDDGKFTMFIDLVREKGYASSLVDRNQGVLLSESPTIEELFQKVRNNLL